MIIRATKRCTFEMAHALRCHDGQCAHIHGHSYVLDVTLRGVPLDAPDEPKDGMLMDFAELKSLVKRAVIDQYDHTLVLHEKDRTLVDPDKSLFGRTRFVPWQPTCENLLLDVVRRLESLMPLNVTLAEVRLQETATSWAEWRLER
ncbi:MAG: 6-carboxytetrahydropterin synthase [Flavobacteriales bacterium]|nr:6-carboxytetrahydropterin synthase [Flavobacteriales bacterium]